MNWRYRPWWLALGALAVVTVIVASLSAVPDRVDLGGGRDKLGHFSAYFFLTAWFGQLYRTWKARWLWAVAWIALGVALEWVQGGVSYRAADPADALANATGVAAALAALLTPFQHWLARLDAGIANRVFPARRSP